MSCGLQNFFHLNYLIEAKAERDLERQKKYELRMQKYKAEQLKKQIAELKASMSEEEFKKVFVS